MTAIDRVVLLAEPDLATAELYQRTLRVAFDTLAVSDEDTVLDLLRTEQIAAVVLEPAMFAAQGWEQLSVIGRLCAERSIPLVICSTLDERRRGFTLGATRYLVKPTLPATLLDTLRQLIGS